MQICNICMEVRMSPHLVARVLYDDVKGADLGHSLLIGWQYQQLDTGTILKKEACFTLLFSFLLLQQMYTLDCPLLATNQL